MTAGERFFQWVDRHAAVAVFSFALGAIFTALAAQGAAWAQFFGILTALGTLAAAFAALGATAATRSQLQQQLERDHAEKSPNVRVGDVTQIEPQLLMESAPQIVVNVVNMSAAPILITEIHTWDDQSYPPSYEAIALVIAAGEKNGEIVPFYVSPMAHGQIVVYFQYSPTGVIHHRITVPYERVYERVKKASGDWQITEKFWFRTDDQFMESGARVKADLDKLHRFWLENPLRVVDVRPLPAKEKPEGS